MEHFPTCKQYAKNAVQVEQNLSKAIDSLRDAHISLSFASSKIFDQEIKTLESMERRLHQMDLLLCNMETRTVKVEENKRG